MNYIVHTIALETNSLLYCYIDYLLMRYIKE